MSKQNFERLYVGFHNDLTCTQTKCSLSRRSGRALRVACVCVGMFVHFICFWNFCTLKPTGQAVNLLCVLTSYLRIDKISFYCLMTAVNEKLCIEAAFREVTNSQH